jgi:hypothetical protein
MDGNSVQNSIPSTYFISVWYLVFHDTLLYVQSNFFFPVQCVIKKIYLWAVQYFNFCSGSESYKIK